jgi:hypothetical protein
MFVEAEARPAIDPQVIEDFGKFFAHQFHDLVESDFFL